MDVIRPVVLSGGSGTRLWPISTDRSPKQFADLFGGGSLFARTLQRLDGVAGVSAPVVVTGVDHLDLVQEAAHHAGVDLSLVIAEPVGRNTAPAVAAAALALRPDEVMVILPSDHVIADPEGLVAAITEATPIASGGAIVTFGILPTRADTGYGYIELGDESSPGVDGVFAVRRFKEKPGQDEAGRLVADGRALWNSGMFMVSAGGLLAELELHRPEILETVRSSMREPVSGVIRLGEEFGGVESVSLDHAVMERTRTAVVMPIDVGWDDVGSFEALWSASQPDGRGNVTRGDVTLSGVSGSFVAATSRRVAVAGMEDVVVVETPEAVLVVPRSKSQMVRDLVDLITTD